MPPKRPSDALHLHAGFTGARPGDCLRGSGDAEDAVIRIVSGVVHAAPCFAEDHDPKDVRDAAARLLRCTPPEAERAVADFPLLAGAPNHLPIGAGCFHDIKDGCSCPASVTMIIESQGRLQHWAELHGNGDELAAMVEERRPVTWRAILRLFFTPGMCGGKTLALRCHNYQLMVGPSRVGPSNPLYQDRITARLADEGLGGAYLLEGHVIELPTSGRPLEDVLGTAATVLPDVDGALARRVIELLTPLSAGALKSLLQKCARFHAVEVDLTVVRAPTRLVSVVALLLLFKSKGSFSPELQLFTRGCTAALKRLAVILLEDAWCPGAADAVRALVALALVTQRMPDYYPALDTVVAACRLVARATDHPEVIGWRQPKVRCGSEEVPWQPLHDAAALMRIVRSFPGDMDMFDQVAAMARRGPLPMRRARERPDRMPIEHMVDQHAFRGVAHPLVSPLKSFAKRLEAIFGTCTGRNPRLEPVLVEADVAAIRAAQQCCARFALALPRRDYPLAGGRLQARLPLDPGVLSAGVGPIEVHVGRKLLVLLGLACPEDVVVMKPPARTPRDLFGDITADERARAVAKAQEQRVRLASPLLRGAVRFAQGRWLLDDRPWEEVRAEGLQLDLPLVAPPAWLGTTAPDSAVAEALECVGEGVVPNPRDAIRELVGSFSPAVGLRAASLLQQQWRRVAMPTPDLAGGRASDQLAAYPDDWVVWRLLVLVSRLAPGALRPEMPPTFGVPNPGLLRLVEQWVREGARRATDDGSINPWPTLEPWASAMAACQLMEHQSAAVAAMIARDAEADTGHFLVMDTGLGKTVTALRYAYHWLCAQPADHVRYILWITPSGTVDNLLAQLRDTWGVPAWQVPRVSTARKPKAGDATRLVMKPHLVNVIHADHVRTALAELGGVASECLIVFDEVDEMYGPTLRTSAARCLARLCPKFVAQTATPMRKNESELLTWLSDTCAFPVEPRSLLPAASSMVSTQLELGIEAVEELVVVSMVDEVRAACRDLASARDWGAMARVVQHHTDELMVDHAIRLATLDRETHPAGGALLVADSQAHAARLMRLASDRNVLPGDFASMQAGQARAVVVITKHMDRGYNCAVGLGAMVTGAYGGNASARHQLRGRLRRIGQKRDRVTYATVVMQHSILELLHQRHSRVDLMNLTLQQLAEMFESELLEQLNS